MVARKQAPIPPPVSHALPGHPLERLLQSPRAMSPIVTLSNHRHNHHHLHDKTQQVSQAKDKPNVLSK
jgi:hypothetical protein